MYYLTYQHKLAQWIFRLRLFLEHSYKLARELRISLDRPIEVDKSNEKKTKFLKLLQSIRPIISSSDKACLINNIHLTLVTKLSTIHNSNLIDIRDDFRSMA